MATDITLAAPLWNSELARVILDLEKLRQKQLYSEVPPYIFLQLKNIFQRLETLGSARIEGNNTTLAEYVEKIIEKRPTDDEKRRELENIEQAISFIEGYIRPTTRIDRALLSQLHVMLTDGLTPPPRGEGSNHPGMLRPHNVEIQKSAHVPPFVELLSDYFDGFITFINEDFPEQNQLLMVAAAHHRFMYIHPFDNGNGRLGRLLNYALLLKLGFNVDAGVRIFNPSSVFYTDRDKYYEMLSLADSLEDSELLTWSEYFLSGLKNQIEKINLLMNRAYTRDTILLPALKIAQERQHITKQEHDILSALVRSESMTIKSSELDRFGITGSQKKSYVIGKLRDKHMVTSTTDGGRTYTISFVNNYLLRSVIQVLEANGFIAEFLNKN